MYKYEKNTRISEDEFIYGLNYLPMLNVLVFKYENINSSSGQGLIFSYSKTKTFNIGK